MRRLKRFVLASGAAVVAVAMVGCSSLRPYPNNLPKNLLVHTRSASGSLLNSRRVSMNLYEIKTSCKREYLGTVGIHGGRASVGVPVGRVIEAEIDFHTGERLGSNSSDRSFSVDFVAKRADRYRLDATYLNGFYDMSLLEYDRGHPKGHKIESLGPRGCGS